MNDKEIRTIADLMATLSPEEQERIEREVKKIGKQIEAQEKKNGKKEMPGR
jgi:hypothetical protein